MREFENAIKKSQQVREIISSNITEDTTFIQLDMIEKAKTAQIGEIREWKDGKYQRTKDGWVPVKSKKSKEIGQTSSGKPIYEDKSAKHDVYKDYSVQDHLDAHSKHLELKRKYQELGSSADSKVLDPYMRAINSGNKADSHYRLLRKKVDKMSDEERAKFREVHMKYGIARYH